MTTELTIIVPTYNEYKNIPLLISSLDKALQGIVWEALFVDDDSPDGTASLIREIAKDNRKIHCLHRIGKKGRTSACIEGLLACESPYACIMDADLQHDEQLLPEMLRSLKQEDLDMAIGSRYVESGSTGALPLHRVWVSKLARKASNMVLQTPIFDPTSGFFMIRKQSFLEVYDQLSGKGLKGFEFLLDILASADGNLRYKEFPYIMRQRKEGDSKLDLVVIWEFLVLLIDRLMDRMFAFRLTTFVVVGFSGVFVHLLVLGLIYRILNIDFIISQSIATLIAMTSNFILNNHFIYRDKKYYGKQFMHGLINFYIACSIGAVINVSIAGLLYKQSVIWWLAGAAGAVAGTVWNYIITSIFTCRKKESES